MIPIGAARAGVVSGGGEVAIPDSGVNPQSDWFWPADDGSGGTITEERQGDDASITGAGWEDGSFYGGTAVLYDGSDDYANAPLGSQSYTEFSVFVACRLDSSSGDQYAVEMKPNYEPGPSIRVADGSTIEAFTSDGGGSKTLTGSFSTGELRTIGFTAINNDEAFLMGNGDEQDSASVGSLVDASKDGINFGADRSEGRHWDGVIDVVLLLVGDSWSRSQHQTIHEQYMDGT